MVTYVPNIHLGIYKNYQNFHPLIFYGYTRLRGVGADLPHPECNRVKRFSFLANLTAVIFTGAT